MKKLILFLCLGVMASSCSFFKSDKPKNSVVDVVYKASEKVAVKHLECETGKPFAKFAAHEVEKFLKVKEERHNKSNSLAGGVFASACEFAVEKAVLPKLKELANGEFPESWKDDGCSSDKLVSLLSDPGKKLCGKIPI